MEGVTPYSPNVDAWIAAGWAIETYYSAGVYYSIPTPQYVTAAPPPYIGTGGRSIDAAVNLANKLPLTVDPLPPPSPSGSDMTYAAFIAGPNGAILASKLPAGMTLTPAAYTPGSAVYQFTQGGTGVPAGYVLQVTLLSPDGTKPLPIVYQARPIAPGSPTFRIDLVNASTVLANGRLISDGTADGYGFTSTKTGVGKYDGTLTTAPASQFVVQVTPSEAKIVRSNRTGADTFTIETYEVDGTTPVDLTTAITVLDDAVGGGFQHEACEGYFQVTLTSLA